MKAKIQDDGKPKMDFFRYADGEMKRLATIRSASTVKNYKTALNALAEFLGRRRLPLDDVSRQLMRDFEQWLLHHGRCRNASSAYMRSLHSLFNRAVDAGLTSERNPFQRVFTGNDKTRKRALGQKEMNSLLHVATEDDRLRLAADVCRFSFAACGMSFADVARLRWSDIEGDRLTYRRQKTDVRVSVRLEKEALSVLHRYRGKGDGEYVFPLIRRDSPSDYVNALARYNRALQKLANRAGISRQVTSYAIRHTWATEARRQGVPTGVTAQGLGHTHERTTEIYLASIDQGQLDHYNRKLLKMVFNDTSSSLLA